MSTNMQQSGGNAPIPRAKLRTFFTLTAIFHVGAIVSAAPEIAAMLPELLAPIVLWVHFPLLLLCGYLEARSAGEGMKDAPLWMHLDSRTRISLALAVSYLFVMVVKTYNVSLGPVDPLGLTVADPMMKRFWYGMWTLGISGILAMGPAATLASVLRVLTAPARKLPTPVALVLLFALGLAAGYGALLLLASVAVRSSVASLRSLWELNATTIAIVTAALAVLGALYAAIFGSKD